MKLTPAEIAAIVKGKYKGNHAVVITGVAAVDSACGNDVTYIARAGKAGLLDSSKAGCVLAPAEAEGKISGFKGAVIYAANPKLAFALILRLLEKEIKKNRPSGVHPSAVLGGGVSLGKNVHIGPYVVVGENVSFGDGACIEAQCFIGDGVSIGAGSRLYPQVVVRENCVIGGNVILHSGAVIGSDGYGYIKAGNKHEKIPQIGKVVIEDDVEIGASSTIDRAMLGETVIGRGTKIDNLVHIAHNVRVGGDCLIIAQTGVAGSAVIGDNVILAGQAGVAEHVTIGDNAVVLAKSGVMSDLGKGQVVFGLVGRPRREAMRLEALISKLPEIYDFFRKLSKTPAKKDRNP